jgi:hypothetical protein
MGLLDSCCKGGNYTPLFFHVSYARGDGVEESRDEAMA